MAEVSLCIHRCPDFDCLLVTIFESVLCISFKCKFNELFTSTETIGAVRDGGPRTSASTLTQLLTFSVALRPQKLMDY